MQNMRLLGLALLSCFENRINVKENTIPVPHLYSFPVIEEGNCSCS